MPIISQYRGISTLICLALSQLACDPSEPDEPNEPELETPRSSGSVVDAACPIHRQVAIRHPGAPGCPAVTGWTPSSVFGEESGPLAQFCKYQWDNPQTTPDLTPLTTDPQLLSVGSDCEVVLEQSDSDALWDVIGSMIEALFHQSIRRVPASDLGLPGSESSRWPVVVAVIDSVPEPAPDNPRSEHGERMASLIEDIACPHPKAPCKVEVWRSLGLPRYGTGQVDLDDGGYFGSLLDLAQAIYESVEHWRNTDWGAQTPRLILNLSVGWEGELFGDITDPTVSPAVAAVYSAIEVANCEGAAVVVAAGNRGHLCMTKPLLPGGWEQLPSPNTARCALLGINHDPGGGSYRPLVYSVGGVDYSGQPLPSSREEGMPRLVASSTHAVSGGDSLAMTGTSVSAASASGAAALVWSYNPDMSPDQVMNAVYAGADLLPWQADYAGPNVPNTNVRRLNVCAALERACSRPNATCPSGFATLACQSSPNPVTIEELFTELGGVTPDHHVAPTFGAQVGCPGTCGAPEVGHLSTGVVGNTPCPVALDPAQAYTEPQPTQIGCPNCTLDPISAIVLASIDPSYDLAEITDVTVTVDDGIEKKHFRLGPLSLSSTEVTSIQLAPTLMPAFVRSASISLTFAEFPRAVVNELLIRVQ